MVISEGYSNAEAGRILMDEGNSKKKRIEAFQHWKGLSTRKFSVMSLILYSGNVPLRITVNLLAASL